MKHSFYCIILLFLILGVMPGKCYPDTGSLRSFTAQNKQSDDNKLQRNARLNEHLEASTITDYPGRFNTCLALYNEYQSFNYHRVLYYAKSLQDVSLKIGDRDKINYAFKTPVAITLQPHRSDSLTYSYSSERDTFYRGLDTARGKCNFGKSPHKPDIYNSEH